jgi:hypothetical protein
MSIKHAYVNPKSDPVDVTLIKPSNWNADHDYPARLAFAMQFGDDPYRTASPGAALAELYSEDYRSKYDMTNVTEARVVGQVQRNINLVAARIAVQYSLDQSTWAYLDGSSGPFITLTPIGMRVGSWVNLAAGAKADVWLRWVSSAGNGDTLQWYHHHLQVR